MKMNKVKLAFLSILVSMATTFTSCESDTENIESIESTETAESRIWITVESGEEIIIPLGWGDEESAEIIVEPENAVTSELQLPYYYVYQSENDFTGRERVRVKITDYLEGTERNEIIFITVEAPLVGVIFD